MTFAVKTKKTQFDPIRREKRYKRQISRQRSQIKRRQTTKRLELQIWERMKEREVKLETTHHPHWLSSSTLWRKQLTRKSLNTPLLSALVTSDWPRARKSNNPTTTKHRIFFHFLIPYQHVYITKLFELFTYLFFSTIVKIFTCLRVLCF